MRTRPEADIILLTGFDLSGSGGDHVTQLVSYTREGGPEGGRGNLGQEDRDDTPRSRKMTGV